MDTPPTWFASFNLPRHGFNVFRPKRLQRLCIEMNNSHFMSSPFHLRTVCTCDRTTKCYVCVCVVCSYFFFTEKLHPRGREVFLIVRVNAIQSLSILIFAFFLKCLVEIKETFGSKLKRESERESA